MSTTEPTQDQLARFVRNEVHLCISGLVSTLAKGCGATLNTGYGPSMRDLLDLFEKAGELSYPVEDWQEAAEQEGWTGPHTDEFGATFYRDDTDGQTWAGGSWQELCEAFDIEAYEWEIYEHWAVSECLADLLEAEGERVDRDFEGLNVWGRTTTGQAIYMDSVIGRCWARLTARANEATA